MRGSTTFSISFCYLLLAILFSFNSAAQSIADVVLDCKQVKGNVESVKIKIIEFPEGDERIERYQSLFYDKKRRLVSIKELTNKKEIISERNFFYIKNNMIKQESIFLGEPQHSFFYQYNKSGIPLKVMEINPKRELLTISNIFLDSLYRPILLKNYDLAENLIFEQVAQYDEPNNRLLVQKIYPKEDSNIYQYQLCSKGQYLETIPTGRFESYTIKTLKKTKENNIMTIVKAVTAPDGKEDIHIQEIKFDDKDNWIKSNLYRLKKRKQKKILLQQIERKLVYR